MNPYAKYTPLRITLPFIAGIVFQLYFEPGFTLSCTLILSAIGFTGITINYFFLRMIYRYRWLPGILSFFSLFFTGLSMVMLVECKNNPFLSENYVNTGIKSQIFLCRLEERPAEKSGFSSGYATILAALDTGGSWKPEKIKVRLYLKSDSICRPLAYGDIIIISGNVHAVPELANPDAFNYRKYLANRQVYYQCYLDPYQWGYAGKDASNPIRSGAEYCSEKLLDILRAFHITGEDFALSSALLIGVKDYLENDTRQEFSNAGAMHVLCVSGLHVGILFVVADKMLFFLKRSRKGRRYQQVVIIIIIWAYAFITGLSASVMRAALMFSLIAASRMFKRTADSYNILAVAAFFQLLIDPFAITHVGFQLSYLAVLGIFTFFKPLDSLISSSFRLVNWVWSILSVSMAAQLGTFAMAIYYFNLFPVYFLLTNLIVVPLAALIIYLAIALLVLGLAGYTIAWFAWPFTGIIRFMIGSVHWIQSLPGAVIEPVVFSTEQVILIYVLITALFLYIVLIRRQGLLVMIGALFLVIAFSSIRQYTRSRDHEIIIYKVSGYTAIDLIHNRKVYFICDTNLIENESVINFSIKPHRLQQGGREVEWLSTSLTSEYISQNMFYRYPFIWFHGRRITLVDENWNNEVSLVGMQIDMIILKGNPKINADSLKSQLRPQIVIIDSSVPAYLESRLEELFEQDSIQCHSVRRHGAYRIIW